MKTIFFVEDDSVVVQVYRAKLLREGFGVEVAEDGLVAVKMLAAVKPDVVVLDLMMPKLNGAKLIEQLKSISPETPALLLSGCVSCCPEEHLADAWIPKGELAPMELLERIRVLLIRKRGPKRTISVPQQLAS